jgi:sugar lactone lactonase YvrE
LTIAPDGKIYATDPHRKRREWQAWRIAKLPGGNVVGERMTAVRRMSTTNGIDLTPTARAREAVFRFRHRRLRADTAGNLYVARILKGTIAVLTPAAELQREIEVKAKESTNLAFGGDDGKMVFVTQRQGGLVESFRTDRRRREFWLSACPGRK